MKYNTDITHCSGYLCPLKEKCLRYKLFLEWDKMNPKPLVSFIQAMYDENKNKCSMFRKLKNYDYESKD